MKRNLFTFVFALFIGMGLVHAQSADQPVGKLLKDYYALKDALVASDKAEAAKAAKTMLSTLQAVDASELDKQASETFAMLDHDLEEAVTHISKSEDLNFQRAHFNAVSKHMTTLVKATELEETVYVQYCPMANKNKGGGWLSAQKEILNPYYGSMMLKCGMVKETL